MRPRWRAAGRRVALFALFVVASLAAAPGAAQGLAGELDAIENEANTLRGRFDQLRPQFLQPTRVLQEYSFSSAYLDGRYYYSTGAYGAAVSVLLPLVEDTDNARNSGYNEAVFVLAETLFAQQNYLMARRYYTMLADDRNHGLDAARRRLEVALAMGRYDELEDLYRALERRSNTGADDQVTYVRGKALYFQDLYADALAAFDAVRADSPLYDRARYFVGVCHARMGQYDRAHAEFQGVLQRLGETPEEGEPYDLTDLRDLTLLADGRIYYEQQDWLGAVDAYIEVSRDSERYPASLYEIAWTQIRLGTETDDFALRDEYLDTALNVLEILTLIASSDSRFQARAQLLRGDLLLRMERYDQAVDQFEQAAEQYYPVELEMREIRERHDDPDMFFDAIVNPQEGTLRLPVAARPWFDSDPRLDRALLALSDVESLRAEIADSQQLIAELDAALNSGGRINAFPQLREGWLTATEIQVGAIRLLGRLIDAKAAIVVPGLGESDALEYQALNRRRTDLQLAVLAQPRTFAEIGEREVSVVDDLNEMLLDVHRTELRIEAAREDLEALREIYIERAGGNPSVDMRTLRNQLDEEERRLNALAEDAQRMRQQLNLRQVEIGVSDDVGASERSIRRQFREAIQREEVFLHDRRAQAPVTDPRFDDIRRLLGVAVDISDDCEAFYVEVDRMVAEQTADMRDLLERERANVERYEERLQVASVQARETAGDVAIGAFEDVYQRFSELTLRASLGIIDVAWQEKEVLTDTIDRLFDERNASLQELDADFAELLEGE